jgi:hypothetical protein
MATRTIKGTHREVWQENTPLGAGLSQIVTTGIRANAVKLSNVAGVLRARAAVDVDAIVTTPAVSSSGLLTLTIFNGSASAFPWLLDISLLHSIQQGRSSGQGPVHVVSDGAGSGAVVETMIALRAYPTPQVNNFAVNLLGFHAPGDGGGGQFIWNSASTLVDDGGLVIRPTTVPVLGRWLRVMDGWNWTATQTPDSIGQVNVRWFGAKIDFNIITGLGTDDSAAVQAAITATCLHGNVADVYFPWGNCRITQTLKLRSNCVKFIFTGATRGTLKPDFLDVPGLGSVICAKEVVGPVVDIYNASEGGDAITADLRTYALASLTIDGANGGGSAQGSMTITHGINCHGETLPLIPAPVMSIHLDAVCIMNVRTVGAIAIDLSRMFWIFIENSAMLYFVDGYGLFSRSVFISSTTLNIKKTYLHGNLECASLGINILSAKLENVVFESSLNAINTYGAIRLDLDDCWFENIGAQMGTLTHPLTRKSYSDAGPYIETPLFFRWGCITISKTHFAFSAVPPFMAAVEVAGANIQPGGLVGGDILFDRCVATPRSDMVFFSTNSALALNGGFTIRVNDPQLVLTASIPNGIAAKVEDARMAVDGYGSVTFGAADIRPVIFKNGRFIYGIYPDTAYSGPLIAPPLGSANLKGDRVRINQPNAGDWSEYVCVTDGVLGDGYVGTWKGCNKVDA